MRTCFREGPWTIQDEAFPFSCWGRLVSALCILTMALGDVAGAALAISTSRSAAVSGFDAAFFAVDAYVLAFTGAGLRFAVEEIRDAGAPLRGFLGGLGGGGPAR